VNRDSIYEKQGLHLLLLVPLLLAVGWISRCEGFLDGSWLGVSTATWFWLSILFPVVHQVWVWVCWRMELHRQWLSRSLGPWGFRVYGAGFALLAFARLYTLTATAVANEGSLDVDQGLLNALALVLAIPALYTFYSVGRYFSYRRALGIDHFDASYRTKPFVREGIFRFTRNGMYTFGLMIVWLPGLIWASKAALLSAAFSHLYIWVHYFCTELPDMRRIYGAARADGYTGPGPAAETGD
jgi:hypothetical protein